MNSSAISIIVGLMVFFIVFSTGMLTLVVTHNHSAPKCQEDDVIVGTGNFSNGYWDSYKCVNIDEVK